MTVLDFPASGEGFYLTDMITTRRSFLSLLTATGAAGLTGGLSGADPCLAATRNTGGPVVLELFTSQGCSSCPPADKLLGELAGRPDVIALAYHVDYWNYIGWTDPFSSKTMSDRQRRYAAAMGLSTIYTPQLVIDGEADIVGSHRGAVLAELDRRRVDTGRARVAVDLRQEGGEIVVSLSPTDGTAGVGADLILVGSDDKRVTEVPRGENSGRTLAEAAIVRFYSQLGTWDGTAARVQIPASILAEPVERLSLLVQTPGQRRILGAGTLLLKTV